MKVKYKGGNYAFVWCPGCDEMHMFVVFDELGNPPKGNIVWTWDRNLESPTFGPSILVKGGSSDKVCHSFLIDGVWQFLNDSTHALAGLHVPMVDLPDWLASDEY